MSLLLLLRGGAASTVVTGTLVGKWSDVDRLDAQTERRYVNAQTERRYLDNEQERRELNNP